MKRSFLYLFICVTFFTCKDDPLPVRGDIAGRVTEEGSNVPIPGVTVVITGREESYVTGEDGTYIISNLFADNYSVSVSKTGYIDDKKTLSVEPDRTTIGDFSLKLDLPEVVPNFLSLTTETSSESIELLNTRSGEMSFTSEASQKWIQVAPSNGTIASQNKRILTVNLDLSNIEYGSYEESIVINVGAASISIPIQIEHTEPPYISLKKPLKDEIYKMGEIMSIDWTSNMLGKVKLELLQFSSTKLVISSELDNDSGGSHSWSIPALDSASYQIKITDLENAEMTQTSDAFTIIPGPTSPTVITKNPTELNPTSIKIEGEITSIGIQANQVDQYGHVYSKNNPNPTISDNKTSLGSMTNPLVYVSELTGLDAGQTYYVAAYATNTKGTSYGDVLSLTTTSDRPVVQTANITAISQSSAISGGTIVSDGGSSILERGLVWNTSSPATVDDNIKVDMENTVGSYSISMSQLEIGMTYYVRAYAKNDAGVGYGEEKIFSTIGQLPSVNTTGVSNATTESILVKGNVTDDGGESISSYGFCYSSSSSNPTINDSFLELGTSILGAFEGVVQGLNSNTSYFVRAYATNGQGTSYGSSINFTTSDGRPSVQSNTISAIDATSVNVSGNVIDSGEAILTSYGFCYSTFENPSLTENVHEVGPSTTGAFDDVIDGLTPTETYYFRAYATNSYGTSYGNNLQITLDEGNYLLFNSPYEGEEYLVNETSTIAWESNLPDRRIIIEHWYDGGYTELSNSAYLSDNSLSWYLDPTTPVGQNNTIKIIDYTTLSVLAESKSFNIPGALAIDSPSNDQLLNVNSIPINWTINYSTTLSFDLFFGSQLILNIASGVSSDLNQYEWDASGANLELKDGYRIKIIDENNPNTFVLSDLFNLGDDNTIFLDTRDAQFYRIITIDTLTWFAEDLNYQTANSSATFSGREYPRSEISTACPSGWHVATDENWQNLESYAGMSDIELDITYTRYSGSVGTKLKSETGWMQGENGTNDIGFNALPRDEDGNSNSWWTSSIYSSSSSSSYYYIRSIEDNGVSRYWSNSSYNSIRCVQDQ